MADYAVIGGALLVFAALLSMADYKQVGARLRERIVPMSLFFGGLALAIIVIRVTAPKPPSVGSVNGAYRASCCELITLKDGFLITSRQRIPFKLRIEKWGNEAKLVRGVRISGGKIVPSSGSGDDAVLFDKNWKSFTLCDNDLCGPGHEFEFARA